MVVEPAVGGSPASGRRGHPDRIRHPLMVTSEVAELFRVTSTTVIRWAEKGRITCSRTIGGHLRFQRAEIEALARSVGIAVPELSSTGDSRASSPPPRR
jgi:excisionase family DNA binding protein